MFGNSLHSENKGAICLGFNPANPQPISVTRNIKFGLAFTNSI